LIRYRIETLFGFGMTLATDEGPLGEDAGHPSEHEAFSNAMAVDAVCHT